MKRPSPLVLTILLLAVVAKLSDRPFVPIIAACVIVGLLFFALGRLVIRRETIASAILRRYARWGSWLAVGIAVAVAFFAMLATQPSLRSTYVVGQFNRTAAIAANRGFYPVQTDESGNRYAWTQERATFVFNFLVHRPITVTVMMRSAAIAGGPDVPIHIEANGQEVAQMRPDPNDPRFQPISVRFVPHDWGGQQTELRLLATPFVPGKGDTRTLGTMIQSVTIDKSEAWAPIASRRWLLWGLPVSALIVLALMLLARRSRTAWAGYGAIAVCAIGASCALALLILLLRAGFIEPDTYFSWLTGSIIFGLTFVGGALALPFGGRGEPSIFRRARGRLNWLPASPIDVARRYARRRISSPAANRPQTPMTRRHIARDLLLVFMIALGLRLVWVVLIPPWLAPDEPDHYIYVSHIAQQGQIPHPPYLDYAYYPKEYGDSVRSTLTGEIDATFRGSTAGLLPYFPVAFDYGPGPDIGRSRRGPTHKFGRARDVLSAILLPARRGAISALPGRADPHAALRRTLCLRNLRRAQLCLRLPARL